MIAARIAGFLAVAALAISPVAAQTTDAPPLQLPPEAEQLRHVGMNHGGASIQSLDASISGETALGQPSILTLTLKTKKGAAPVGPDALASLHTEKVHVTAVDPSLTDYQHLHPQPGSAPGTYTFTMTPKKAGTYKVFVNVQPTATNKEEFDAADFTVPGTPDPIQQQASSTATVDGYKFDLEFAGNAVVANRPAVALLTVTGPDGRPFNKLEAVMDTYAHLASISENREELLHLRPTGDQPALAGQHGGPALTFRTQFPTGGFKKIFAQVQIDGKQLTIPFGANVEGGETAEAPEAPAIKEVGNKLCPVSGDAIDAMGGKVTVDYKGYRVNLCCPGCKADFAKDGDALLKKALAEAKTP